VRSFEKGRFEVVRLGGMTIGRVTDPSEQIDEVLYGQLDVAQDGS